MLLEDDWEESISLGLLLFGLKKRAQRGESVSREKGELLTREEGTMVDNANDASRGRN